MQVYTVIFPPIPDVPESKDVTIRRLHVEVDGVDKPIDFQKAATSGEFKVLDGKDWRVWLLDVDDVGNEAVFNEAFVSTGKAVDDIPPANAGGLTIQHTGEEPDPVPVPAPPA